MALDFGFAFYRFVYLSIYPPSYLSIYLFIYLFIYIYVYIYLLMIRCFHLRTFTNNIHQDLQKKKNSDAVKQLTTWEKCRPPPTLSTYIFDPQKLLHWCLYVRKNAQVYFSQNCFKFWEFFRLWYLSIFVEVLKARGGDRILSGVGSYFWLSPRELREGRLSKFYVMI